MKYIVCQNFAQALFGVGDINKHPNFCHIRQAIHQKQISPIPPKTLDPNLMVDFYHETLYYYSM